MSEQRGWHSLLVRVDVEEEFDLCLRIKLLVDGDRDAVALLGQARSRVVTRLAAFILLCVGVQVLMTGVQDALGPIAGLVGKR